MLRRYPSDTPSKPELAEYNYQNLTLGDIRPLYGILPYRAISCISRMNLSLGTTIIYLMYMVWPDMVIYYEPHPRTKPWRLRPPAAAQADTVGLPATTRPNP